MGRQWFETPKDRYNEAMVAGALEDAWRCDIHRCSDRSRLDWHILRNGRLVAIAECKARTHATISYPTVWLRVVKYSALRFEAEAFAVPGLFVVAFTDGVRWIDVADVDASPASRRIAGWRHPRRNGHQRTDTELVIDVPMASMRRLEVRP